MQAYSLNNVINESIYFDYAPPPTFAGHINRNPFRVVISSSNDNEHYVYLDSKYSKSYYKQDSINKWSFLRPESRFLDLSGKEISIIKTNDTRLYLDDNGLVNTITGTFIGVSGYAEFYFVDDWYNYDLVVNNMPYSCILATLQTSAVDYFDSSQTGIDKPTQYLVNSKGSNSIAVAEQPHIFHYRPPEFIKISENGIRDYINPRWVAARQPVVFSLNWKPEYEMVFPDGNQIKPININSNFCKTHPFSATDIPLKIKTNIVILSGTKYALTTAVSAFFISDLNIYYQDKNGYLTAGYNKNSFDFYAKTTLGCAITASTTFKTPDLSGNFYSPKLWVSNPNAGCVGIVEYNNPSFFTDENFKNFNKIQLYNFDVPVSQYCDFSTDAFAVSGFHGINSIAVLPTPEYGAWACDGELSYLYKFGTMGQILCAIDLNKISQYCSPASIALDSDKNIWMTLNDTLSVLKFDKNGNFLFGVDASNYIEYDIPPNIDSNWFSDNEDYPNTITDSLIQPTYIDTDLDNNVWVTYSHFASGMLIKYDQYGNLLNLISYPPNSCPQDIVIDNENNIWVALSNTTWNTLGTIEKRNTNGVLLSSIENIMGLNNLALDLNQNLWFTCGYSKIGYLKNNSRNKNIVYFDTLDYTDKSKSVPKNLSTPDQNTSETALEGIACDSNGNVYVINSIENQIYLFDYNSVSYKDKFYVNPQGFNFYPKKDHTQTTIEYHFWQKSLQAFGDWTGFKWANKYQRYGVNYPSSYTISLSGVSRTLDIFQSNSTSLQKSEALLATTYKKYIRTRYNKEILVDYANVDAPLYLENKIDLYKVNENFDFAKQIRSISFIPSLYESDILLNQFLPNIFGIPAFSHFDLGVFVYEKIANFVKNIKDVDTANINQLYDLSGLINENTNDYRLSYPNDTKRIMDIISVNQSRLWGSSAMNQNNFDKPNSEGIYNRGNLLTLTYQVTAGVPVVLKTKSLKKYEKIETGSLFVAPPTQITLSLNNFSNIILDIKNTPKTTPNGFVSDSTYKTASENILLFKPQLQQQIIDYANYYFPYALSANETLSAKCYRDIGYIIDAISADIANNANHRSIDVSDIYFKGSLLQQMTYPDSSIPAVPLDQVYATISSISALEYYITGNNIPIDPPSFTNTGVLSSIESGSTRINDVISRIRNIIYTLQNNGEKEEYSPTGNPSKKDIELGNALLNNKSKIKTIVAEYVAEKGYLTKAPPDPILSAKCNRDVGLMIDSVVSELRSGVMSKSIEYALAYWEGSTSRLPENIIRNQKSKTIDTINYLKEEIINVIKNEVLSTNSSDITRIKKILDNYNNIILSLSNVPKTLPAGYAPDGSYKAASLNILKYKSQLQQQVVTYVKYNFPNTLTTYVTESKCYRDTGYIIDAISADIANNANHRSIDVGDLYFKGTLNGKTNTNSEVPTLPQDQITATIEAIQSLGYYITGEDIPNDVPSFTKTGVLSSVQLGAKRKQDIKNLLADIVYPLQNNGELKKYHPVGYPNTKDLLLADIIESNKNIIQDKVAQYVYSKGYLIIDGLSPDLYGELTQKCTRDVGYMVDAVANDLITGVVSKSIQYALAYWNGSTSRLPETALPQQVKNTIDTINYLDKTMLSVAPKLLTPVGSYIELKTYPLEDLVIYLGINKTTGSAWNDYYEFYEFVPGTSEIQIDGLIDWQNPATTINRYLSSYESWVGAEKTIDRILSYDLYQGLGLL